MVLNITVNMSEFKVVHNPAMLEAIGIGSCVAVCLYDWERKIGGLAHIMLASSIRAGDVNPLRFADKAIPEMLKEMLSRGCKKENIKAKIFGGASLFPSLTQTLNIGEDNVKAVRQILKEQDIRIVAEDVGGEQGRNVWLDTTDGKVVVSKIRGETREV